MEFGASKVMVTDEPSLTDVTVEVRKKLISGTGEYRLTDMFTKLTVFNRIPIKTPNIGVFMVNFSMVLPALYYERVHEGFTNLSASHLDVPKTYPNAAELLLMS